MASYLDTTAITLLITEFRQLQAKDSVTPETVGALMQRIITEVQSLSDHVDRLAVPSLTQRVNDLTTLTARLSTDINNNRAAIRLCSEAIDELQDTLAELDRKALCRPMHGVVSGVSVLTSVADRPQSGTVVANAPDEVVFDTESRRFLLRRINRYYANWYNRQLYMDGDTPRGDVLYIDTLNNRVCLWAGSCLVQMAVATVTTDTPAFGEPETPEVGDPIYPTGVTIRYTSEIYNGDTTFNAIVDGAEDANRPWSLEWEVLPPEEGRNGTSYITLNNVLGEKCNLTMDGITQDVESNTPSNCIIRVSLKDANGIVIATDSLSLVMQGCNPPVLWQIRNRNETDTYSRAVGSALSNLDEDGYDTGAYGCEGLIVNVAIAEMWHNDNSMPNGFKQLFDYMIVYGFKDELRYFDRCRYLNFLTSIGDGAEICFDGFGLLESIILPASLTSLGAYAFRDCASLREIDVPEGVTTIGAEAFAGCSLLERVTLPSTLTSIGNRAFAGCPKLRTLVCKATTAPTLGTDVFGNAVDGYSGSDSGDSRLYIPVNTSGYDSGQWADPLTRPAKCGFSITHTIG